MQSTGKRILGCTDQAKASLEGLKTRAAETAVRAAEETREGLCTLE